MDGSTEKRVVIAGGNGLVGSRLIHAFLAAGTKVSLITRRPEHALFPLGVELRHWGLGSSTPPSGRPSWTSFRDPSTEKKLIQHEGTKTGRTKALFSSWRLRVFVLDLFPSGQFRRQKMRP